MAPDYSIGFTQKEVETIMATQKKELAKVLVSFSDNGTQAVRRKLDDINAIIAACQKALVKMDPEKYGARHNTLVAKTPRRIYK